VRHEHATIPIRALGILEKGSKFGGVHGGDESRRHRGERGGRCKTFGRDLDAPVREDRLKSYIEERGKSVALGIDA